MSSSDNSGGSHSSTESLFTGTLLQLQDLVFEHDPPPSTTNNSAVSGHGSDFISSSASVDCPLLSPPPKPFYPPGTLVYAAYPFQDEIPLWYSGRVVFVKTLSIRDATYGCSAVYTILFDDDDLQVDTPEHLLIPTEDYRLSDMDCQGVVNVKDNDTTDLWAKHRGWYQILFGGEITNFTSLATALALRDCAQFQTYPVASDGSLLNDPNRWSRVVLSLTNDGSRQPPSVTSGTREDPSATDCGTSNSSSEQDAMSGDSSISHDGSSSVSSTPTNFENTADGEIRRAPHGFSSRYCRRSSPR